MWTAFLKRTWFALLLVAVAAGLYLCHVHQSRLPREEDARVRVLCPLGDRTQGVTCVTEMPDRSLLLGMADGRLIRADGESHAFSEVGRIDGAPCRFLCMNNGGAVLAVVRREGLGAVLRISVGSGKEAGSRVTLEQSIADELFDYIVPLSVDRTHRFAVIGCHDTEGNDPSVAVIDLGTGLCLAHAPIGRYYLTEMSCDPMSDTVLICARNGINQVRTIPDLELIAEERRSASVWCAARSPTTGMIAIIRSGPYDVELYDARLARQGTLVIPRGVRLFDLRWSQNGRFLYGYTGESVLCWELEAGALRTVLSLRRGAPDPGGEPVWTWSNRGGERLLVVSKEEQALLEYSLEIQ